MNPASESVTTSAKTGVMVAETSLHVGALSFPTMLAQCIAQMSPAFGLLLAGSFIAAQVG